MKDIVAAIKGAGGKLEEDEVVSKVFVTLVTQYAITMSSIQEMKSIKCENLNLYSLI